MGSYSRISALPAAAGNIRHLLLASVLFAELLCNSRGELVTMDWNGWQEARATFYGGDDAEGTMGGACGYGDLYTRGYGTASTALSNALFNGGLACGACFQLVCKLEGSKWCYGGGKSITVTATNSCPPGSTGGWCDPPKPHFDLSYPMFATLAQKVGGVIPVRYRRVTCAKNGGIRFTIDGNPWFALILVHNVGGSGDVELLSIRGDKSANWLQTRHNWGQFWSANYMFVGQTLSFRCKTGDGRAVDFWNTAPNNWAFLQTFEADYNF